MTFAERMEAEGEATDRSNAWLIVLEARGLPVSDELRTCVCACRDVVRLEAWLRRA